MAAVVGRQWISISRSGQAWATMAKPKAPVGPSQTSKVVKSPQSVPVASIKSSKGATPGAQCVVAAQHSNARIKKSNRRSRFGDPLSADDFDEEDFLFDALSSDVDLQAVEMEELEAEAVVRNSHRQLKKLGKTGGKKSESTVSSKVSKVGKVSPVIEDDVIQNPASNRSSTKKAVKIKPSLALKLRGTDLTSEEYVPRRDWEEQAYQIIKRQKMRDALQEKLEDEQERLEAIAKKARQAQQKATGEGHMTRQTLKLKGEPRVNRHAPKSAEEAQTVEIPEPCVDMASTQHQSLQAREGGATEGMDFKRMARRLSLDQKWRPLIEYLQNLGLQEGDFSRIVDRHKACLQANVKVVKERVAYLLSLGVKSEDLPKLIVRHPQILEYRVEQAMKPRVQYLRSLGVEESKLGRIITVAPTLLECSLERSIKPRISYLIRTVGIKPQNLSTIVSRSPQILTQSIEDSIKPRVDYFLNEVRLSKEALAKMVTKHPQLLHYSVEDGIRPRVEFLRSIGMGDDDIIKALTRLTQILSLSVDTCLQPKYDYLVKELKGGVQTVTSFPAYFSLSLDQRIIPRHKYLEFLEKCPKGPFPMRLLTVSDVAFCEWAKSSLEDYQKFRQDLLLSTFAKKFEWKNNVHI
ncbi:mTERF domain-containing protein, mitochondrial [Marchantia polymorpha subsp. ruderalis]|uniref:Uncharacterized protein n=3 Tax=Marchantia polymorpha TaxID=3197 RepID=A0A176W9F0_MARPO|nr:hypothetical protein AXG93_3102s1300 [Marchantia polymorpha subsp. ruderalis]PTQ39992.1 hypothetical protein MARPO_0042s0040 [Marchantia polymorpha]BBN02290.1 hypothetical protein Mp_2g14110 [Marchantia polymorpha subsp. ruderalis]|eukprot:PTQ39992.1 hypothetical protein MARPO_0042s0040 [Marchantia polymorpha]